MHRPTSASRTPLRASRWSAGESAFAVAATLRSAAGDPKTTVAPMAPYGVRQRRGRQRARRGDVHVRNRGADTQRRAEQGERRERRYQPVVVASEYVARTSSS